MHLSNPPVLLPVLLLFMNNFPMQAYCYVIQVMGNNTRVERGGSTARTKYRAGKCPTPLNSQPPITLKSIKVKGLLQYSPLELKIIITAVEELLILILSK